ncbi:MAG: 4-alpha-glucanotransferase [Candidatus Eisenbacteria bacterium]
MDLFSRRTAGLLLHPTSLPGPHGAGDLGPDAHLFLEFLAAARLGSWQMLPIGPPGRSSSPYDATSAFAGSPALISLVSLCDDGLLRPDEIPPFGAGRRAKRKDDGERVDLRSVWAYRLPRLRLAFERAWASPRWRHRIETFREAEGHWAEDHALFAALKDVHRGRSWTRWDEGLRSRKAASLKEARKTHLDRIWFHLFLQLVFDRQWKELRKAAREREVLLIGDVPIYVALESADVWSHPRLFDLGKNERPKTVAGVPPDYFNRNGQLWGNPTYLWERHAKQDFSWWVSRFERTLSLFDNVRLDHFIGFHRGWVVPASAKTARRGRWRPGPGHALFAALERKLGPTRLIAEDLGLVTPEVERLRDDCGFPGMRLLQFAWDGKPTNLNLPHNLPRECVLYTGTHDNKTMMEWFEQDAPDNERHKIRDIRSERRTALAYLDSDGESFHWDLIRAAYASVANTLVLPVQDVLGLGKAARMNRPGTSRDNWNWRMSGDALHPGDARRLAEFAALYDRTPIPLRSRSQSGRK